jgi:hypothetical protein
MVVTIVIAVLAAIGFGAFFAYAAFNVHKQAKRDFAKWEREEITKDSFGIRNYREAFTLNFQTTLCGDDSLVIFAPNDNPRTDHIKVGCFASGYENVSYPYARPVRPDGCDTLHSANYPLIHCKQSYEEVKKFPPGLDADAAYQVLQRIQAAQNLKADAWDAYYASKDENDLAVRLQSLNLSRDAKDELLKAKKQSAFDPSVPYQPGPAQIPPPKGFVPATK